MRSKTLVVALAAAPLLTGLGFALAPQPIEPTTTRAATAADTFQVDAGHSHVLFRTTHLGLAYAHGRFNGMSGTFTLGDAPSIEITIDATSVDTQNAKRDGHLKGPDFFNSGEYPNATFKSTKVESSGEDTFTVTGDLILLGKSKSYTFEAKKVGEGKDPWEGYRAGLAASFEIKRSDFGMNWGLDNGAVGDEVLLEISLEGVREK